MNTLELQSDVVSRDEEVLPTSGAAAPPSLPAQQEVDDFLVRADASLFLWVFR